MTHLPEHWIPHRRDDGEVVGWIDLDTAAPDVRPIDRLGRPMAVVSDWNDAEAALEERGLRFLMARFRYRGTSVRIRHVYDDRIIVTTAVTDAVGDAGEEYTLPFPAGDDLIEIEIEQ